MVLKQEAGAVHEEQSQRKSSRELLEPNPGCKGLGLEGFRGLGAGFGIKDLRSSSKNRYLSPTRAYSEGLGCQWPIGSFMVDAGIRNFHIITFREVPEKPYKHQYSPSFHVIFQCVFHLNFHCRGTLKGFLSLEGVGSYRDNIRDILGLLGQWKIAWKLLYYRVSMNV